MPKILLPDLKLIALTGELGENVYLDDFINEETVTQWHYRSFISPKLKQSK